VKNREVEGELSFRAKPLHSGIAIATRLDGENDIDPFSGAVVWRLQPAHRQMQRDMCRKWKGGMSYREQFPNALSWRIPDSQLSQSYLQ
jgi:hypothetical protein